MVDGHDSRETMDKSPEGSVEDSLMIPEDKEHSQEQNSTTTGSTPTTTISTIAVQSGETRLVIALLQVRGLSFILRNVCVCMSFVDNQLFYTFNIIIDNNQFQKFLASSFFKF
ncbi:hypothetical protein M0804_014657 [Polistes exclamans]|nr:hypothetical protein M0804_014660 [Polistes exclamans]KAI4474809.1 hypothetical protein M0804_014657 [Polistes exclamans]